MQGLPVSANRELFGLGPDAKLGGRLFSGPKDLAQLVEALNRTVGGRAFEGRCHGLGG
jgi:hypothetical protein